MSPGVRPAACCLITLAVGCTSQLPPSMAELPDAVMQYALETIPSGEVVSWRTAANGMRGTVTPVRTFRGADGFCRDYAATISGPEGKGSVWQSTACRDGAGVWRSEQSNA